MKKTYWIFSLCIGLAVACKKNDNPATTTPDNLTQTISTQLSKTDSLSSFNSYFSKAVLSQSDISGGITVFALPNSAFGNGTLTPGNILPDSSLLKDYIVKGVLKSTDFTNNKTLTTLSGKTLSVSVSGDTIRVNGVIISLTAIASGPNYIIYGVRQLFRAAAPVVITVWDASKWASGKPNGELAAQATVSLYRTQEDYAAGGTALYTTTTGADGTAVFHNLAPGHYYIVAAKGAVNNVPSLYSNNCSGPYQGYAASGIELDVNGDYVKLDANADGIVNRNDVVALPFENFSASQAQLVALSLTMVSAFRPLQTAADVQAKLDAVYSGLRATYENLVLIDGMMSDDAGCETSNSYCVFDNFTFTANVSAVATIWNNAYVTNLPLLNYALRDLPGMNIPDDQRKDLIAQAKGLRGYIYLELLTYFGGVPIQTDLASSWASCVSRNSSQEVYDALTADLTAAAADLPLTRTEGKQALTKYAALGLLAKAALYKKDYVNVTSYTSQIISSGAYTLATVNSWLTDPATSETIWAPTFSQIGSTTAWYYNSTAFPTTTVQFCPVLRYGEILLMSVEAQIASGNPANYIPAGQTINTLRVRNGLSPASFTTLTAAFAVYSETWQKEMYRQGDRFSNLVRWGMDAQVLSASGYTSYHSLLPVPQSLINSYPGLVQNPGY